MWILIVIELDDSMPLYPEKDGQHLVQFLWDSPNNGILFLTRLFGTHKATPLEYLEKFWLKWTW